jgi:hypothetical protein
MGRLMKTLSEQSVSPLKKHAVDALRRARKLPVGPHRNDLRQLAIALRRLDRDGIGADYYEREAGTHVADMQYQG